MKKRIDLETNIEYIFEKDFLLNIAYHSLKDFADNISEKTILNVISEILGLDGRTLKKLLSENGKQLKMKGNFKINENRYSFSDFYEIVWNSAKLLELHQDKNNPICCYCKRKSKSATQNESCWKDGEIPPNCEFKTRFLSQLDICMSTRFLVRPIKELYTAKEILELIPTDKHRAPQMEYKGLYDNLTAILDFFDVLIDFLKQQLPTKFNYKYYAAACECSHLFLFIPLDSVLSLYLKDKVLEDILYEIEETKINEKIGKTPEQLLAKCSILEKKFCQTWNLEEWQGTVENLIKEMEQSTSLLILFLFAKTKLPILIQKLPIRQMDIVLWKYLARIHSCAKDVQELFVTQIKNCVSNPENRRTLVD